MTKTRKRIIGALVVLLAITIIRSLTNSGPAPRIQEEKAPQVATGVVANLSIEKDPLPVLGTVNAASEVSLRAETSGRVTRVYRRVGDVVSAGTIIAEVENSSERAVLVQAEAAVESATANLEKARKGVRDEQSIILDAQVTGAQTSYDQATTALANAVRDSFSVADTAVRTQVDSFFIDDFSGGSRMVDSRVRRDVPDSALVSGIEAQRIDIQVLLNNWEDEIISFETEDELVAAVAKAEANLTTVRNLLNDSARALQALEPEPDLPASEINGWETNVSQARTAVGGSLQALFGSKTAFANAKTGLAVALQQQAQGTSGDRAEDIAASEANLKSAQANYAAALARYEETVFRTPIAGTITLLPISQGDFISNFDLGAQVSNKDAFEVVTYIAEGDRSEIKSGNAALVEGKYRGIVTSVAPALDERTKKIEVRIILEESALEEGRLLSGQSVNVAIERTKNIAESLTELIIPISALKIGATETFVFTVNASSTLVSHPVTEGSIIGDKIIIEEGLTPEMEIVLDARGLREGDLVEVK